MNYGANLRNLIAGIVLATATVFGLTWLSNHSYDRCVQSGRILPGAYIKTRSGIYRVMTDNGPGWDHEPRDGKTICLKTERTIIWD